MPAGTGVRKRSARSRARPWRRRRAVYVAGVVILALAGLAAYAATRGPAGTAEAAIPCSGQEMSAEHIHAHLQVYVRGQQRVVPANIGLRPTCLFWLHTHDATGLIHVEAGAGGTYTLGQFFGVWGQPLSGTELLGERARAGEEVRVLLNGQPNAGDPRSVPLRSHEEIVLELGPPYPPTTAFTFPPGT